MLWHIACNCNAFCHKEHFSLRPIHLQVIKLTASRHWHTIILSIMWLVQWMLLFLPTCVLAKCCWEHSSKNLQINGKFKLGLCANVIFRIQNYAFYLHFIDTRHVVSCGTAYYMPLVWYTWPDTLTNCRHATYCILCFVYRIPQFCKLPRATTDCHIPVSLTFYCIAPLLYSLSITKLKILHMWYYVLIFWGILV